MNSLFRGLALIPCMVLVLSSALQAQNKTTPPVGKIKVRKENSCKAYVGKTSITNDTLFEPGPASGYRPVLMKKSELLAAEGLKLSGSCNCTADSLEIVINASGVGMMQVRMQSNKFSGNFKEQLKKITFDEKSAVPNQLFTTVWLTNKKTKQQFRETLDAITVLKD